MDRFKTARVLVLDDKPSEAMPVLQALGLLGIGAIYNDGSAGAVYAQKLTGVRVMFVDMVLGEHGADANDPSNCVRIVAEALHRLIEDSCDPVIVVCWTGNPKMTAEFELVLKKTFPNTKIDGVILADKIALTDDLEKLKNLITAALEAQSPVNVLFRWEQIVHDASTRTTGAITRLVQQFGGGDPAQWNECGYRICAALAFAERGARLIGESEAHATKALFDALNPLLADRLDHSSVPCGADMLNVGKRLLATVGAERDQQEKGRTTREKKRRLGIGMEFVQQHLASEIKQEQLSAIPQIPDEAFSLLSAELRAALNTMLHLSKNVVKGEACPGSIFVTEFGSDNRKKLKEKLTDNHLNWQEVLEDTFVLPSNRLPGNHFPALIEFTAACDFAQDKTKYQKFVVGFLVPEDGLPNVRTNAYTHRLGPLMLSNSEKPRLDGVYHLVVNVHFVLGIVPQIASELVPLCRLRSPILAEVTSWISNHISRPGVLHVGP